MRRFILAISVLTLSFHAFSKEDDKEKKKIEKEERSFQKNVEKHPDDANIYWEHANKLADYNSSVKAAQTFYLDALSRDSSNALIYKDYGKYLLNKLGDVDSARAVFTKALMLIANDNEVKDGLAAANKAIERRDIDNKMRSFGNTTVRQLDSTISYASLSNFDSLKALLIDNTYKNNYQSLLERFLADDKSLKPEEMYLLIIGYTKQSSYSPFNYNDISSLKITASHNLDSAIKMGKEIINTNPINPSLNRELMYYYRLKNDTVSANKYLYRVQQFFNGVLYSGNGTCERPYISLWAKEEYNFIDYLGYKRTDVYSMGVCAGQMAEILEAINITTAKREVIHFNIKLIYLHSVEK